jgi:alanyl-tRNA synthetase
VRSTGEIGPILIRKLDKIRGNVRIEFLCGMRAVRQARSDYTNLNRVAQLFSLPLDEAPSAVENQIAKLSDSEKQRSRLLVENAQFRGAKLYVDTPADADGIRRHHTERKDALGEDVRAEAQSFTANPKTIYVARAGQALLLAASADSGVHAGNVLKAAVTAAGGRGGGSAQMAQGSVPLPEEAARIVAELFAVAQRGD